MSTNEDVIDLLLEQHQQVKQLMSEINTTGGPRKREAFEDLVRLLAVHESAEEEVVHPVSRDLEGAKPIVDERLQEEGEAKKALAELYDLGVDHVDFDARFEAFAADVLLHATHEEQEEFPRLREEVTPEKRRRMAAALRAAEAIAPTRPHPAAGESAAANLVAGPPLALFDRTRDAVRDWSSKNKD
jgi:hemerythrin superfamily protein